MTPITQILRENAQGHKSVTLWFTGFSGAGKTTIGQHLERKFFLGNIRSVLLDGDVLRSGLCQGLGFSPEDRSENLRRAIEVAKITQSIGLVNICCFISPFSKDRELARKTLGPHFLEVYVKCPIETCIQRDPKGLYKKAQQGKIINFTGLDSPYEIPDNPEIILDTLNNNIDHCVNAIVEQLIKRGYLYDWYSSTNNYSI